MTCPYCKPVPEAGPYNEAARTAAVTALHARDDAQRFRYFAPEPRPVMPEGYAAPLNVRPLSVLIAEADEG